MKIKDMDKELSNIIMEINIKVNGIMEKNQVMANIPGLMETNT